MIKWIFTKSADFLAGLPNFLFMFMYPAAEMLLNFVASHSWSVGYD